MCSRPQNSLPAHQGVNVAGNSHGLLLPPTGLVVQRTRPTDDMGGGSRGSQEMAIGPEVAQLMGRRVGEMAPSVMHALQACGPESEH